MRRAATSLLEASCRSAAIPEDHLTEVFSCVLEANQEFAAAVMAATGLTRSEGTTVRVGTQRSLSVNGRQRRVDMELVELDGVRRTALVYVENKRAAAYSANQLEDDYDAVQRDAGGGNGRVLTIVEDPGAVERDPRWTRLTWHDTAALANKVGREWGGRQWRHLAMAPNAPASVRYLAEYITHLENEELARMEPLRTLDVVTAQRSAAVQDGITRLLNGVDELLQHPPPAAGELTPLIAKARRQSALSGLRQWRVFELPAASWVSGDLASGNVYAELLFKTTDSWLGPELDEPAFCAGFTFNENTTPETRARLLEPGWRLPLDVASCPDGGIVRVVKTLYFGQLVVQGATLDEQVAFLADWARDAISAVAAAPPPPGPGQPLADGPR